MEFYMDVFQVIASVVGSVSIALVSYVFKLFASRIDLIEQELKSIPNENSVRQIIDDKLAPHSVQMIELQRDIKDIKVKLDKVFDLLMHEKYQAQ
jgi:hypothetical protein